MFIWKRGSILDNYIIAQLIPCFVFGITLCSFVAELIGISFEQVRFILEQGLPIETSIYIHCLKLPAYITIALPYAVLLASILTYSHISRNSEVIAIQSCGVSLYRLAIPALVMGLIISLIMFVFHEFIVPPANYNAALVLEKTIGVDRNILDKYNKRNIVYREDNSHAREGKNLETLFFAEQFDGEKLIDVTIVTYVHKNLKEIIFSQAIQWNEHKQIWQLSQGSQNFIKTDGSYGQRINFETLYFSNLSRNLWDYVQQNRDYKEMRIWELYRQLKILKNTDDHQKLRDLHINIYQRYTNPFSCVMFAFLGFAASIHRQVRNSSVSSSFGITIITIYIYSLLNLFTIYLCHTEVFSISLSVWFPNLTGAIIAGFILITKT